MGGGAPRADTHHVFEPVIRWMWIETTGFAEPVLSKVEVINPSCQPMGIARLNPSYQRISEFVGWVEAPCADTHQTSGVFLQPAG